MCAAVSIIVLSMTTIILSFSGFIFALKLSHRKLKSIKIVLLFTFTINFLFGINKLIYVFSLDDQNINALTNQLVAFCCFISCCQTVILAFQFFVNTASFQELSIYEFVRIRMYLFTIAAITSSWITGFLIFIPFIMLHSYAVILTSDREMVFYYRTTFGTLLIFNILIISMLLSVIYCTYLKERVLVTGKKTIGMAVLIILSYCISYVPYGIWKIAVPNKEDIGSDYLWIDKILTPIIFIVFQISGRIYRMIKRTYKQTNSVPRDFNYPGPVRVINPFTHVHVIDERESSEDASFV